MIGKNLKKQIDEIQDSSESDDVAKVQLLNKVIQDVEDSDDMEKAMQMLAWYNLEGEKTDMIFLRHDDETQKNGTILHFCPDSS